MSKFNDVLFKKDISDYAEIFNSLDSDDVVVLLREVQRTRRYSDTMKLADKLDEMLLRLTK